MTPAPLLGASPLEGVESLDLRHLCDISIDLEVQTIASPAGNRMFFALMEGRCEGERLRGTFRSNSGDWMTLGADQIGRLDVRSTLETHDGELVYMTNTGRLALNDEALARIGEGERVGPGEFYGRSAPLFETGSEAYAWLNGIVTVATHEIAIDHVNYRIFEVL